VSFASRIEETTPGIMTTGASAWILVKTRTRRRRLGKTREGNMVGRAKIAGRVLV
jgi:hypothetical protein